MSSESYHEPIELISTATRELHRGIVSLIEEFEAIDWYQQRADACTDGELRAVLLHHRDEETEHAMMNLEWLRRHSPIIDEKARIYLFSEGPILETEARAEAGGAGGGNPRGGSGAGPGESLRVGSLKRA
jgi:uncharacterized protein